MKKNAWMIFGLTALLALLPRLLTAEEKENRKAEVLDSITKGAAGIRTISSDFVQERRTSMLREPLIATGRFFFERPERLRWEFLNPAPSGFLISGKKAQRWGQDGPEQRQFFDIEREPAIKTTAEQVFAWARGDLLWIEKRYDIRVGSEEAVTVVLNPRFPEEKKDIQQIALSFSFDLSHVTSVEIRETQGDSTRIRFMNVVINPPLPKDLF